MNKKLIIANWKSHKTKTEVLVWLEHFVTHFPRQILANFELVLTPSLPYLDLVNEYLKKSNLDGIKLASQDNSPYPLGKYTGATAAAQLRSVGCNYALIGHSERRRYFAETPQIIAQKVDQALANNLVPIVCVDDDQIEEQAQLLNEASRTSCIVLYEPLKAIGTGMGEDVGIVQKAVALVKQSFSQVPVIYGGSVNVQNISEYLLVADGVGVGTASLDVEEFLTLVDKLTKK